MKPPISWTPEEARQAMEFYSRNPDATDVGAALAEYKIHEQKRVSLMRPEQFTPERPPAALGLRMLLPDRLGGLATSHYEPTLEDFRKTSNLTPDSPEEKTALQDFRDEAWAKAFDEAKAAGRPLRRAGMTQAEWDKSHTAAMKTTGEGDMAQVRRGYQRDLGGILDLAGGYTVPGIGDIVKETVGKLGGEKARQYVADAQEMNGPASRAALTVGGALLPGSLLGKLGGAIGKTLGPAESALGGLAKGALEGGALGVAGNTLGNVSGSVADALAGKEKKPALSRIEETGIKSLLEAPGAFGGGAALGGILGIPRGFSGGLRSEATDAGRALRAAEAAGARTSFTEPGGIKPPPSLQVTGLGAFEHPTDVAVNKAKPLVARGAARVIDETVGPLEAENEAYYKAVGGRTALMTPMTKTLVNLIKSRSYSSTEGGDLPLVNNAALRKELLNTAEPILAVNHEAHALEQAGGVRVPLDEAISTGMIDRDKAMRLIGKGLSRGEMSDRATMPPGPPDEAAAAWERLAGPAATPPGGFRPNGEHRAALQHIAGMGAYEPPPPSPTHAIPKTLDPSAYSVVFQPKELDARKADEVLHAVDRAAGISEAEGAGRADPAFKELPRAARAVRDQFPAVPGVTDKYPDVTIAGPDGKPLALTGRSAMAHGQAQKLNALQKKTREAGLGSERFDPSDVLQQEKVGKSLFGVGPGVGETNRTAALLDLAGKEPGGERAVKDVIASRILRGGGLSPSDRAPIPSAINPVRAAAQLGHSVKYRLDPVAQFLGRGAPASGIVGPMAADPVTRALLELNQRIQQYGDHP